MLEFFIIDLSALISSFGFLMGWFVDKSNKSKQVWPSRCSRRSLDGHLLRFQPPEFNTLNVLMANCLGGGTASIQYEKIGKTYS